MSEFQPLLQQYKNTNNAPSANNTTALAPTVNNEVNNNTIRFPGMKTLTHVMKMAIAEDKPIMFDYWSPSLEKTVMIGLKAEDNEKLLVKSEEEYTSPIQKIIKIDDDYVITTENSIYLVDSNIPKRKIST
jgi:hypothetical protein